MYNAYFVNMFTGQLLRTSQPSDNPDSDEWKQISHDEFAILYKVANFAMSGWYDINK